MQPLIGISSPWPYTSRLISSVETNARDASSDDVVVWTKHKANPVFARDGGGVDVERVGGGYLMVYESHEETRAAVSPDGIAWRDRGLWAPRSGGEVDRHGHVTPMLVPGGDGPSAGLFAGDARAGSWDRNRIVRLRVDPDRLTGPLRGETKSP